MALGTPTVVSRSRDGFIIRLQFVGDTNTPAGGTTAFQAFVRAAITAANAALADANIRGPEAVEVIDVISGECGQYIATYDKTNDKLKILDGGHATWDEKTGALNTVTFNVTVLCK